MATSSRPREFALRPSRYELTFRVPDVNAAAHASAAAPAPKTYSFECAQRVFGVLKAATREIALHATALEVLPGAKLTLCEIRDGALVPSGDTVDVIAVAPGSASGESEAQNECESTYVFTLARELPATSAVCLSFTVKGTIGTAPVGLFISEQAQGGRVCVTQMQPIDARRVCACVDDPAVKAVFAVRVCAPAHTQAISNGEVLSVETQADGSRMWTFADTPVMSTYLLCLSVGVFDSVSTRTRTGVCVCVHTAPGLARSAEFTLDVARRSLEWYTSAFGIPYVLPKCDNIVVDDLAMAAMENWGAVTYRSSWALVDPATTPQLTRMRVALVVAHELAHQWFGNYVTMRTWTDLWLNEGFASYMEYEAVNTMFPHWGMFDHFLVNTMEGGLRADAYRSSHPVEVPIAHPNDIEEVFDDLTYYKGAAINRMLFTYLTTSAGFAGIGQYLRKFAFANASTDELWEALEESCGKPVKKLMRGFTAQGGIPYIAVAEAGTVRTGRFLPPWSRVTGAWPESAVLPASASPTKADELALSLASTLGAELWTPPEAWVVPLTMLTQRDGAVHAHDLGLVDCGHACAVTADTQSQIQSVIRDAGAIKLNAGQCSYMRAIYDAKLVRGIIQHLVPAMSCGDRIGLLSDVAAAAYAGLGPYACLFEVLWALRHDENAFVVQLACKVIQELRGVVAPLGTHALAAVDEFAREFARSTLQRLGYEPSAASSATSFDETVRAQVFRVAAVAGDAHARQLARQWLQTHATGERLCPADMKPAMFDAVAAAGYHGDFDTMLQLYAECPSQEDRRFLATALAGFPTAESARRTLAAIRTGGMRLAQAPYTVLALSRNAALAAEHGLLAWQWFEENHEWVTTEAYAADRSGLVFFVEALMSTGGGREFHDRVASFFEAHPIAGLTHTKQRCLEAARDRAWQTAFYRAESDSVAATIRRLLHG